MVKCSFCGREQSEFRGTHLLRNDGEVSYYCSSKCVKNDRKLGRDKRKVRWAEAFHKRREKAREKEKNEKDSKKIEKKSKGKK